MRRLTLTSAEQFVTGSQSSGSLLQLPRDRLELLQRRFQVVGDLHGEQVRFGQVFGVFEAPVFEPEMSTSTFSRFQKFVVVERSPATVGILVGPGHGRSATTTGTTSIEDHRSRTYSPAG